MIVIYGFVAFLFFKVFPEFSDYPSNTVTGALVMAMTSALILWAGEMAVSWRIGLWMQTPREDSVDWPSAVFPVAGAAFAGSVLSTWLIAAGFSEKLYRAAFDSYRAEPLLFWAMAAIPPACHIVLKGHFVLRAISIVREARKLD